MRILSGLSVIASLGFAHAADLPEPVRACAARAGLSYKIVRKVAPSYLEGDFDGDGKPDYAVLAMRGGAQGIIVCREGAAGPLILGAGAPFNEMKNLDFTAWRIHPRSRRVAPGAGQKRPPILAGDALYLEWESGSAVVYWKDSRFMWYQQGD